MRATHSFRALLLAGSCCVFAGPAAFAQAAGPAPLELPVLRLEPDGPTAPTNALAFSPDGKTLYAGGFDKVVRAWTERDDGRFVPRKTAYHVPLGPGSVGVINALALSPDGKWLAVGGDGYVGYDPRYRADPSRRQVMPIRTPELKKDQGTIYLFPLKGQNDNKPRLLQGHLGPIEALAFAPADNGSAAVLVSAAYEATADTRERRLLLWDVDQDAPLADAGLGPDTVRRPLALAVARTGNGPKDVRVDVAWGDGKLHVWEPARGRPRAVAECDTPGWNITAARAGDTLITGGFDADGNVGYYLRYGDDARVRVPVPHPGLSYRWPVGLAVVPPAVGRDARYLAVLLRTREKGSPEFYELGLIAPEKGKRDRLVATVPLWWRQDTGPVLAASPDGRHVAVARADQTSIRVYALKDLLAGEKKPAETLDSVGQVIRRVAFARKDGQETPGLLLRTAPPAEHELLFDFAGRRLVSAPRAPGWQVEDDGWNVTCPDPDRHPETYAWSGPNGRRGTVSAALEGGEGVTATALIPPLDRVREVPVLAVATWNAAQGLGTLALYETAHGKKIRELRGHVRRILSLAASHDGRLLASSAEDETVCLWSQTDLGPAIGRTVAGRRAGNGMLEDVRFADEAQGLVVDAVRPGSPIAEKEWLKKGDVIKGLGRAKDARFLTNPSAYEFAKAVWGMHPGEEVWLDVDRGGTSRKDQGPLTVGQGMDWRWPLLTLFLTRTDAEHPQHEWVAWTHAGSYDLSSDRLEQYLGWYRNPEQRGEPVSVDGLEGYRHGDYKPTFLARLLRTELPSESVPLPVIALDRGPEVVPSPSLELGFAVREASLEKGQVAAVRVSVDGRDEQEVDLKGAVGDRLVWKGKLPADRAAHTVAVVVETTDGLVARGAASRRYVPPRPEVKLVDVPASVTTNSVRFQADVSFAEGEKAQPHLFRLRDKTRTEESLGPAQPQGNGVERFARELTLELGDNEFQLVATNAGAAAESSEETTPLTFTVRRERQLGVPRLSLTAFEIGPDGKDRPVDPGRLLEGKLLPVESPNVRLRVGVTAEVKLTAVTLQLGAAPPFAFRPTGDEFDKKLERDYPLTSPLAPGEPLKVLLRASTATGPQAGPAELSLVYRPLLPRIASLLIGTREKDNETITETRKREGPPEVEVKALLTPAPYPEPCKVLLLVLNAGGQVPQADGPERVVRLTAEDAGTTGRPVSLGKVRIGHGANVIRVLVRNTWRDERAPLQASATFLRPPYLDRARAELRGNKLLVTADIDSPEEVPPVELSLDGQKYPKEAIGKGTKNTDGHTLYAVRKEINYPLDKPKIELAVRNADGPAGQTLDVPPLPREHEVEVTVGGPPAVTEPAVTLTVTVRVLPGIPLSKVVLLQKGKAERDLRPSLARQEGRDPAMPEFEAKVKVEDLLREENVLTVRASTPNSTAEASWTTNYVPAQIRPEIVSEPRAAKADYELIGRLPWAGADQQRQVESYHDRLRVFVNGYRQDDPQFEPQPDGKSRKFRVRLRLNAETNVVRFECPGLPLDPRPWAVACAEPERPRLHLLVVDTRPNAVTARDLADAGLGGNVFARVFGYPATPRGIQPLVGKAAGKYQVPDYLERLRQQATSPSDLVLIYWLGEAAADARGDWYLKTHESTIDEQTPVNQTGIPLNDLLTPGDRPRGARLVLLDVLTRAGRDGAVPDVSRTDAAVLANAWSGPPAARDAVALPGLLRALKAAGKDGRAVTLERLTRAAEQLLNEPDQRGRVVLLRHLASQGDLRLAGPSSDGSR
jgi:WD40 repeat protein